jgi:hypothetical protein
MADYYSIMHGAAALCAGGAAASGWTAAVITPNAAFDGFDAGRADRITRRIISSTAGFQAALLGVAAGLALVSGARVAGIVAAFTALGFLSNVWTLSPRKDKVPTGVRKRTVTTRIVAVGLTLIMTIAALAAALSAAFGI